MSFSKKVKQLILGHPLNPLNPQILRHVSLVAFLAWVGLGADGLSSSCYGPEEAYIALGRIHSLPYTSLLQPQSLCLSFL